VAHFATLQGWDVPGPLAAMSACRAALPDEQHDELREAARNLASVAASGDRSPDPCPHGRRVTNRKADRDSLAPLVRQAAEAAGGADQPLAAWERFQAMARVNAEDLPPPLAGITSGGVLYWDGPKRKPLTYKAFAERLRRMRKPREPT